MQSGIDRFFSYTGTDWLNKYKIHLLTNEQVALKGLQRDI